MSQETGNKKSIVAVVVVVALVTVGYGIYRFESLAGKANRVMDTAEKTGQAVTAVSKVGREKLEKVDDEAIKKTSQELAKNADKVVGAAGEETVEVIKEGAKAGKVVIGAAKDRVTRLLNKDKEGENENSNSSPPLPPEDPNTPANDNVN